MTCSMTVLFCWKLEEPAGRGPPCSAATGLPTAGEAGPLSGEVAPLAVAPPADEAFAAAASRASCDAALLVRETGAEFSCKGTFRVEIKGSSRWQL